MKELNPPRYELANLRSKTMNVPDNGFLAVVLLLSTRRSFATPRKCGGTESAPFKKVNSQMATTRQDKQCIMVYLVRLTTTTNEQEYWGCYNTRSNSLSLDQAPILCKTHTGKSALDCSCYPTAARLGSPPRPYPMQPSGTAACLPRTRSNTVHEPDPDLLLLAEQVCPSLFPGSVLESLYRDRTSLFRDITQRQRYLLECLGKRMDVMAMMGALSCQPEG